MPDSDSSSINIEQFRRKMEKRQDFKAMHLPRSFAHKTEQLFGSTLGTLSCINGTDSSEVKKERAE
ncbi:MAG: hypothetical protein ACL93V_13050 [Candidatus Electrothrix sp. YB6]